MKLSATMIHALEFAADMPTNLTSSYYQPTIRALLKHGLIESYGAVTICDGEMGTRYGITDEGRTALVAHRPSVP